MICLNEFVDRFVRMRFMPNKTDRARLNQKYRTDEKAAFVSHIQEKLRQSRRTIRSGYAFAQQEGWGPLITSGRMQTKATSRVRPSHIVNVSMTKKTRKIFFSNRVL
jgi:phospholipid-translocating ATPase